MFQVGDKVNYVGSKTFIDDKGNPMSLKERLGIICARVQRTEDEYVVDFSDDSFILHEKNLVRFAGYKEGKEPKEPEVTRRRKKTEDDAE